MKPKFLCVLCKVAYLEKPTHTTSCPYCHERLSLYTGQITDHFVLYGSKDLKLNRERCWLCAKSIDLTKKAHYLMSKPLQCADYEMTDMVHKRCWSKESIEEKQAYGVHIL